MKIQRFAGEGPLNIGKLLRENTCSKNGNQMEIWMNKTKIGGIQNKEELLKSRQSLISELVTGKLKVTTNE